MQIKESVPFSSRMGRKVLVIDEIQSKRHQEGRERGYADKRIVKINERLSELAEKCTPMGDPIEELYMVGEACDASWAQTELEAFTNNNGVFTWTGNLRAGKRFRFLLQDMNDSSDWWPSLVLSEDGINLHYATKEEECTYYLLDKEGVYTIVIDVRDWKNRSISISKVGEIEWSYTVAGSFNGAWNLTAKNACMTFDGKYYVAKNVPMQHGSSYWGDQPSYILFRILETGSWTGYSVHDATVHPGNTAIDVIYGAGGNITVDLPEGDYDVYFDKQNCKVWVMTPGRRPE